MRILLAGDYIRSVAEPRLGRVTTSASRPLGVFDIDGAAMEFDQVASDIQTQAHAAHAAAFVGLEETLDKVSSAFNLTRSLYRHGNTCA